MRPYSMVLSFILLLFITACGRNEVDNSQYTSPTHQTNVPTSTQGINRTPEIHLIPSETQMETKGPNDSENEVIDINNLDSGIYLVTMSISNDQLNIWDLHGERIGVFFPYSIHSIIDPTNSMLAYESAVITSSAIGLFGTDFGLYDLNSDKVLPVEMPEVEWGHGIPGAWAPDSKNIVITTLNDGVYTRLALVTTANMLAEEIVLWDGEASFPDWSPDGKTIAFSSRHFSENYLISTIFLMDTTCLSSLETCIGFTKEVFSSQNYGYIAPSWAPDSTHLVFKCYSTVDESANLCIGDIETGEVSIIENTQLLNNHSDWSPDGKWICVSYEGDAYIIKPDGTESRLIAEDEEFQFWINIPD